MLGRSKKPPQFIKIAPKNTAVTKWMLVVFFHHLLNGNLNLQTSINRSI